MPVTELWTPEQVEAFLIDAANTLNLLPDKERQYLNQTAISWPLMMKSQGEYFANAVDAGGWVTRDPSPGPPSRAAIGRYEEIMRWLQYIDGKHCVRDRKIVFYGCFSMAIWKRDTIRWSFVRGHAGAGMHPKRLRRAYKMGLEKIAGNLNAKLQNNRP